MGEEEKKETKGGGGGQSPSQSRRDAFRSGFATRHPDIDMDDEEAYYGALDDEYNTQAEELNRHRSNNEKMNRMFMENPNAAYFMNDLVDGKEQIGVSLMRHFGETFKDAVDDPTEENVKAFADALDAHAAEIKENERLQDEFEKNAESSEDTIDGWAREHKATGDQIDAMRDFINGQFSQLLSGIVTPEMLDFAYKGLHYDNDVAAAEERGAANGRNERIQEKMRKGKTDGVPLLQGGGKANGAHKAKSIFDLAAEAR